MTATVMLTGATGYLGSHLASALIGSGFRVVVLKRARSSMQRLKHIIDDIRCHDLDGDGIRTAFDRQKIDAIVHCAVCYGRNGESSLDIFDANARFPLQLLQEAIDHSCDLFVNIDTALPDSLNEYTLSKSQFRQWGRFISCKRNIRFVNAKIEHFYGPQESANSFVSRLLSACKNNEPELLLTKGEQKRDFVYIDDVVSAIRCILDHGLGGNLKLYDFEIGSGQLVTIRELAEAVHRLSRSTTRLVFGAVSYRDWEVMESNADLSAMSSLGWQASISLVDGLRQIVADVSAK